MLLAFSWILYPTSVAIQIVQPIKIDKVAFSASVPFPSRNNLTFIDLILDFSLGNLLA